MKITRKQIEELSKLAAEGIKGKRLVGLEYRAPMPGELSFSLTHDKLLSWNDCLSCQDYLVATFEPIAKPTTLSDLVGDDGQKTFYLIYDSGLFLQARVDHDIGQTRICGSSITECLKRGTRWSHSPFTPYDKANKFTL